MPLTIEEVKEKIQEMIEFYKDDLDSDSDWTYKRLTHLLEWISEKEREE